MPETSQSTSTRHPHPQPRYPAPRQHTDGDTTYVETAEGYFPELDPFRYPPGTNLLPNAPVDLFDGTGAVIRNTLPSTQEDPYHLHAEAPKVSKVDPTSPADDLREIFDVLAGLITGMKPRDYWGRFGACTDQPGMPRAGETGEPLPPGRVDLAMVRTQLDRAADICVGNPVPGRAYSGFPLLHYNGPEKIRAVQPVRDATGKITGGNVDVHQVWYDSHIESDTSLLDLSQLKNADGTFDDVDWTITYTIDILNRGKDDFSPMTMYFDAPELSAPKPPLPGAAMDQTFFPVAEGTRTVLTVKMAPPKYFSLTYTWGWRQHPPRVQVMENAGKKYPQSPVPGFTQRTLADWEVSVFGGGKTREQAIAMISDLAPAKRMLTAFRAARQAADAPAPDWREVLRRVQAAHCAYQDWKDRNHLPVGMVPDPDTDLTLLYVNNTIYGQCPDGGVHDFPKWRTRGAQLRVTLRNADYFEHGYYNIDFGGGRGWENQFKPAVKLAGSGDQFTFGRYYWQLNVDPNQPIVVPPAWRGGDGVTVPSEHKVFITYNYEPSRRLRFYQFDPMHHDVAVYSLH